MKTFITIFVSIYLVKAYGQTNSQTTGSLSCLSQNEISQIFTLDIKKKFNIEFTIFKVYSYSNKSGKYLITLTEKTDSITPTKDIVHFKIKAFNFKITAKGPEKQWEVNDFINKNENSIWFWTKYSEFNDIDNDGLIDPILVYGTFGANGYDDGRLKILCFYKDQKNTIRHQNGVLDSERNTQVDQAFYLLPLILQSHIKELMQKMVNNKQAIFPYGWQEAMNKKKLKFDERH